MDKSPDAFRTISEVAEWLGVQTHVLRFWESKFTQVKPVKRAGGRRYYRPSDMMLLGGIRQLLHEDGMTIKGVQKLLREEGVAHVSAFSQSLDGEADAPLADIGETIEAVDSPAPAENVVPFETRTTDAAPKAVAVPPSTPEEAAPEPEPQAAPDSAPVTGDPVPTAQDAPQTGDLFADVPQAEAPPQPTEAEAEAGHAAEPAGADGTPPAPEEPEESEAAPLPAFLTQPMGGTASPAPEPRKPRVIDAPDPPAHDQISVEPGVLSMLGDLPPIAPDIARDLAPLVGRLAVLRDRLAGSGQ